jgi:hypothetical protein
MTAAVHEEEGGRASPPNPGGHNQYTTTPAMFNHCRIVYGAMYEEAQSYWADSGKGDPTPVMVADHPEPPYDGAVQILVWQGFLTKLVNTRLQFSTPYFSHVRNNLIAMGCIKQLQRGGGSSPSRWELLQEPNLDKFNAIKEASGSSYGAVGRNLRAAPVATDPVAGQQARTAHRDLGELRATVALQISVVNSILAALAEHGIDVNLDDVDADPEPDPDIL